MLLAAATDLELGPLLDLLEARPSAHAPHPGGAAGWPRLRHGAIDGQLVDVVTTGVGKANAAAATALAIERTRPRAVLLCGIGGAYRGAGLAVGDVALATAEVHLDTGVGFGEAWRGMDELGFALVEGPPARFNRFDLDDARVRALARRLGVHACTFGTAEAVTADAIQAEALQRRHGVCVESMEGAAAAQVALALGVPFLEVRGISNEVGDRERDRWDVPAAVRNACRAARTLLTWDV